jgi:hypothetical protein
MNHHDRSDQLVDGFLAGQFDAGRFPDIFRA